MPPILSYPLLSNPGQVSIERDPHHFRMVVPPTGSLRLLPRSYVISLILLLLLFSSHLLNFLRLSSQQRWEEIAPAFIVDLVGGILLFCLAYARTHRWSTFEVTADRFRLLSRIFSSDFVTLDVARDDLLEIRLNRHNGKLIVRVQRHEMHEYFITPDQQDTQNIIDKLREALTFSFETIHLTATPAARPTRPSRTPTQHRRTKNALLLAAFILILLTILYPITGLIVLLIAAIAAIPLGIRFGTQEKDLYL